MKHTIGKLACGIMLTMGISAWCSGEEEFQTTSVVFMHWWEPEIADGALQMIVDDFAIATSNDYHSVEVKLVNGSYQHVGSVVHTGGAGDFEAVPDVVGLDPGWVDALVKSDRIEPLDDCIEQEGIDVDGLLGVRTISGKRWMLPLVSDIYVLYYNLDSGVLPSSLQEMIEYVESVELDQEPPDQSLVQFNSTFVALANYALILILSGDQQIISSGRTRMSADAVANVLNAVQLVYHNSRVFARSIDEFGSGGAAMMIYSTRALSWLTKNFPDLDYDLAAVPIPSESDPHVSRMMLRWGVGIMRESKNKEAACKLIAYLVDRQINSSVASSALAFPVSTDAGLACNSDNQVYCKGLEIFEGSYIHDGFAEGCDETELELLFAERIRMMLDREMTVPDTAASIQWAWERELSNCACP